MTTTKSENVPRLFEVILSQAEQLHDAFSGENDDEELVHPEQNVPF